MHFTVDLGLHFFEGTTRSILYESNAVGDDRPFADVLMFSYLVITVFDRLIQQNEEWPSVLARDLLSIGEFRDDAVSWEDDFFEKVVARYGARPYNGVDGPQRIEASLRVTDSRSDFSLKTKGFGLLKRDLGRFLREAVIILWHHLCLANINDRYYLESLFRTADISGKLYSNGKLFQMPQKEAVMTVAILGLCRHLSETTEGDSELMEFRQAAEEGDAQAQAAYGHLCYRRKHYREAVKWYGRSAEQGHAEGQRLLGDMYRTGIGVERDVLRAAELYRAASDQGDAWSQHNLGVAHLFGDGVKKDTQKAVEWLTRAADQGVSEAHNTLGRIFQRGDGVSRNFEIAAVHYQKSAEQGDPNGQNSLGLMHERGQGVVEDIVKAAKFYRMAAEQGHARAQFNLALLYERGDGVPRDISHAVRWYREAAKQGLSEAQARLGSLSEVPSAIEQPGALHTGFTVREKEIIKEQAESSPSEKDGKALRCPRCGNQGEARSSAEEPDAFQVRGKHQGRQVIKCNQCGAGIYVRLLVFGNSPGNPTLIPEDDWAKMQEIWRRNFGDD